MPATEKTWRDQNLLHVVFAVSSLLLLVATIWMIADDHTREWKDEQDAFNAIERKLNQWRQDASLSDQNLAEKADLEHQLTVARAEAPPADLVNAFKEEVQKYNEGANLSKVDRLYKTLGERAKASAESLAKLNDAKSKLAAARATRNQAMEAARTAEPDQQEAAEAAIDSAREEESQLSANVDVAAADFQKAAKQASVTRTKLMTQFRNFVKKARQADINLLGKTKFRRADLDEVKANKDLAVRDGKLDRLDELQVAVDEVKHDVLELAAEQNLAQAHREALDGLLQDMTKSEIDLLKKLDENQADFTRLQIAIDDRHSSYFVSTFPFLGKRWLEMPVGDAFNSPHKIDNLWTEGLTQENGSFGQVRRFDRCTTCHRGIDKTAPGSAVDPAYPHETELVFYVNIPASVDVEEGANPTVADVYGMTLADDGLISRSDVAIKSVRPLTAAATALSVSDEVTQKGLLTGDVLLYVNDDRVVSPQQARKLLLEGIQLGQAIRLQVRRGLPHPYASHPRLDLFIGSLSPHSLAVFGCTVCHEGQGSGTEFKWTSHSPNSPEQAEEWRKERGWFNNHHWIYPMYSKRFAESSCLKCHHDVNELEASDRFPQAPAPKLTKGYHLIERYGLLRMPRDQRF